MFRYINISMDCQGYNNWQFSQEVDNLKEQFNEICCF